MKHFLQERDNIRDDHENGASVIVGDIVSLLSRMLEKTANEAMLDQVRRFARVFIDSHPSMAQVINLCRNIIEEEDDPSGALLQTVLTGWRVKLARQAETVIEAAAREASRHARIVTLSNSRLISEALASVRGGVQVLLSESRPGNEGVVMGRYLAENECRVTLVVDAALPGMLQAGDALFLGCDCLTDESFVNKIGTYPLTLAAKEADVPVYLLCPSSKFLPPERAIFYRILDHEAKLLHDSFDGSGEQINRFFEQTPLRLVDRIISDDGVFKRRQFRPGATGDTTA
jgi:translation initiation factor 2B subunit (eIF-2B alpha/beta/delta family)